MNTKCAYSLTEVFNFAQNYAETKSPKASKILDLIIEKKSRPYLNLCFTYLRWVDDFTDNPSISINEKKNFIQKEQNNFQLLNNNSFNPDSIEEACLLYIAEFSGSFNQTLPGEIKRMVNALAMDVERLNCNGIYSERDLRIYIEEMAKSLFNILYLFLYSKPPEKKGIFLGRFTANAQMIRDIDEDIKAGFINISREDIDAFNLNLKSLRKDADFKSWMKKRINYVYEILDEEVILLKNLPVKFRIFTCYSIIYYLTWIIRAEVYNYESVTKSNKIFLKEIKTYLKSFIKSVNIFFRGFILNSGSNK